MFIFDPDRKRLINLRHVTHLQCLDNIDPKGVEQYYIQYKFASTIQDDDSQLMEQLTIVSKFFNSHARDKTFNELIESLSDRCQLFTID